MKNGAYPALLISFVIPTLYQNVSANGYDSLGICWLSGQKTLIFSGFFDLK